MQRAIKDLIRSLLNKSKIGGSHTPEDNIVKSKTKWLEKREKKDFVKEYKKLINEGYIKHEKKRRGKGMDWHISLNPKRLKELKDMIENEKEN